MNHSFFDLFVACLYEALTAKVLHMYVRHQTKETKQERDTDWLACFLLTEMKYNNHPQASKH